MILSGFFKKIKSIFVKTDTQPQAYAGSTFRGGKFPNGLSNPSTPINQYDHWSLRQNARAAMHDSTAARAIVDTYADTVVDVGLKLKPVPDADILGIDPEVAEQWAENVASGFHLWAKSKKSDRARINNFYQNQRLYQIFQQRDNDIFTRLYYSREKDLFNPLQLQFIDPNQIRGNAYTSTYVQGNIDDGIIRDIGGREIAYKIFYKDEKGYYKETQIPAIGEKSKRLLMLHGFNPEYAGQGRGYSRIGHALQEFENLTDFSVSTIQKAINQASLMAVVENEQQDASQPLEGKVAGPIRQYGSNPQPSATAQNITPESTSPINWETDPEATIREPGSLLVGNLRRGDKLNYLKDTSPSAQYDMFVNSFTSYLAASVGVPIEVVLKKFNNNYSASRATLILFWRHAQIWRDEMAADFLDPVYEMWLSEEIAAGRIAAPGWQDMRIRAAWLACEWAGSPMPDIDPVKSLNAAEKAAALSLQTLDDAARNYNGSSGKANRAKNTRQFAEMPEPPFPVGQITRNKMIMEDEEDGDTSNS